MSSDTESKIENMIDNIMKAFKGEIMETQYNVKNYYLDLYMYDHNIAIECTTWHMNDEDYIKRHKRITKKLKCRWIRFSAGDNIFTVINRIYKLIQEKEN